MSLASWKKEFYRTPTDKVSKRHALKHSIKKWVGLLPKNRRKHRVVLNKTILSDDEYNEFDIDSTSCSLCKYYFSIGCKHCPVFLVTNNYSNPCEREFGIMFETNRVTPMINLLKRAEVEVKKRKRKGKKNESCC